MADEPRVLSVAVVNDHPIVVAGVCGLLEPFTEHVKVSGYVAALPERGSVDVVLFDPFGHPAPATRVAEIVRSTAAKVLVFGWGTEPGEVDAALRLGAHGYLSKTLDGARIVAVLERVDREAAPPGHRDTAADPVMAAWPGQGMGLTSRESQVVCMVTAGFSNAEIAKALYLSVNSIKTYIRSAYRKMGVERRSEAVLWGVDHGMRLPAQGLHIAAPAT